MQKYNYMGKRNFYNLVVSKLNYPDMPKSRDCTYKAKSGIEWFFFSLSDRIVKCSYMCDGFYFKLEIREFDGTLISECFL